MNASLQFRLKCLSRHDETAGVYVGYIPALRVFSQTTDESHLIAAMVSAAQMFIITCYEQNILESALKERGGMTRAVDEHAAMPEDVDYIAVSEYEKSFTVDVPINLVASVAVAA